MNELSLCKEQFGTNQPTIIIQNEINCEKIDDSCATGEAVEMNSSEIMREKTKRKYEIKSTKKNSVITYQRITLH